MRTPLLALALLLPAFWCPAQDNAFEAGVSEVGSLVRGSAAQAALVQTAPAAARFACPPETADEPKLYSSDVRWGLSLPEMMDLYAKLYASDKRLKSRAYYNAVAGHYELPLDAQFGGPVAVPDVMIKTLARHIERAYDADYIDAVFFPDMGHSHLLIPDALYASKYDKYEVGRRSQFYTAALADPAVHIFYHTAEQLKTLGEDKAVLSDPRIRWRHQTRNIAGPIVEGSELAVYQNPESRANTVGEVPGFRWWGAGFNFSANKNGCFSFRHAGKTVRFDISLEDLAPDPANPYSGD